METKINSYLFLSTPVFFWQIVYNRFIERGENMSETTTSEPKTESEPLAVSAFGYELIREELLNELLGKDTPEILYWAGKRLARKHLLSNLEETIQFFQDAGWGRLTIKEESRREILLELSSELISSRLKKNPNTKFQLEAGFIAQQMEHQKKFTAEAFEHPNKKASKVQFTIKWDKTDIIE
jgi:predicted hydrocarbon binding protein